MIKLIILGKGGSGKTHLRNRLIEDGFTPIIQHTTRPIRKNEINGIDYHFRKKFDERKVNNGSILEYQKYRDWHYWTTMKEFKKGDFMIVNPKSLGQLQVNLEERLSKQYKLFKIYLNPSDEIIYERLSLRRDADDPNRRFKQDKIDFANLVDYHLEINNPYF